jgi:hypothetical protein
MDKNLIHFKKYQKIKILLQSNDLNHFISLSYLYISTFYFLKFVIYLYLLTFIIFVRENIIQI